MIIDGGEGNDTFLVLGTPAGLNLVLYGGLGSDTFIISGNTTVVDAGARTAEGDVIYYTPPVPVGNHTLDVIQGSLSIFGGESDNFRRGT